ncbi:MAG: signal peptidase II [Ruminococcaceae bacterium]|nr:signal peptidase II [Oscillospiraceae bacterium]
MFIVIAVIVSVLLVGADQFFKFLVVEHLSDGGYFTVIEGVLRFRYVENSGAVFGSFSNHTVLLTIFSVLLLAGAIFLLVTNKNRAKFMNICLVLMISGGIGNIIDRIRLGYVIDFIEPTFVNFAVFNFADCLITVSAFLIIGYLIYDFIKDVIRVKNKYRNSDTVTVTADSVENTESNNGTE